MDTKPYLASAIFPWDIVDLGGQLYTVIGIDQNTFGKYIFKLEPIHQDDTYEPSPENELTLICAPSMPFIVYKDK
jgi:hypothetical protein